MTNEDLKARLRQLSGNTGKITWVGNQPMTASDALTKAADAIERLEAEVARERETVRRVQAAFHAYQESSKPIYEQYAKASTINTEAVETLDSERAANALLTEQVERLEAENAALREDAARYHWLRDHSVPPHNFYIAVPDEFAGVRYNPREVDAYIDEARAALKG